MLYGHLLTYGAAGLGCFREQIATQSIPIRLDLPEIVFTVCRCVYPLTHATPNARYNMRVFSNNCDYNLDNNAKYGRWSLGRNHLDLSPQNLLVNVFNASDFATQRRDRPPAKCPTNFSGASATEC